MVQAEGGWVAHRPPAIIPVPRLSKVARSASAGLVDRTDRRRGDHRTGVGSSCSLSKIRIGAPTARHVIVSLLKPMRPSIRLLLRCGPSLTAAMAPRPPGNPSRAAVSTSACDTIAAKSWRLRAQSPLPITRRPSHDRGRQTRSNRERFQREFARHEFGDLNLLTVFAPPGSVRAQGVGCQTAPGSVSV